MYVILTSKPGQYKTEAGDGLSVVDAYDYLFYGHLRARFEIAQLLHDTRVCIVDEEGEGAVNRVPSKFFEKYPDVAAAKRVLLSLCSFGDLDARLVQAERFASPAALTS
ncbi:hypothetical protein BH10PSE16_BH10PSE16_33870 [soil metagenome]